MILILQRYQYQLDGARLICWLSSESFESIAQSENVAVHEILRVLLSELASNHKNKITSQKEGYWYYWDVWIWDFIHEFLIKYTSLVNSGYDGTCSLTTTLLYMSQVFKNNECIDKVHFHVFDYLEFKKRLLLNAYQRTWLLFNRHCDMMSVRFKIGQPCYLPVNGS